MKKFIQRSIVKIVSFAIEIMSLFFVGCLVVCSIPLIIYDWAQGAELTDMDEVIMPKPKPISNGEPIDI
jgi:hypothetical protein